MKITKFKHEGVLPDGTFKNKTGAVNTIGGAIMSAGEGCGLEGCHCSDGYWITISMPLKDEIVEGISIHFEYKEEFDLFMDNHEIRPDWRSWEFEEEEAED